MQGLLQTHGELHQPPISGTILSLEFVALHEIIGIWVVDGGLRHTPVIGAPIFEVGLALLNAGFLDLEFGECRF